MRGQLARDEVGKRTAKIATATKSPGVDEHYRFLSQSQIFPPGHRPEGSEIRCIVRTAKIITREDLERNQMPGGGQRNVKARRNLNRLGGLSNLRLDTRAREQQGDDDGVTSHAVQADHRQAAAVMLDRTGCRVSIRDQR